MAEMAASRGDRGLAVDRRERAAVWASNLDRCVRPTAWGEAYVTALDPEPHAGPPADARPDAAAFMGCWPWNAIPADDRGLDATLDAADRDEWAPPVARCIGRYPGDECTPTGDPKPGGWPLCEAHADTARWLTGRDPDAVIDHLHDAERWTTAAGLLPERVDAAGDVDWNANLSWSQAAYVLLARSHADGEPFGMAPEA
jgi:GH15 family glucan-1,4-alpha-glucosidase